VSDPPKRGRPPTGRAKSGAERVREHRQRKAAYKEAAAWLYELATEHNRPSLRIAARYLEEAAGT